MTDEYDPAPDVKTNGELPADVVDEVLAKRAVTNDPNFVPSPGDIGWELREKVPGIDEAAVRWRAEFEGYAVNRECDPAGSIREFMGRAIATAHDRVAVARMGKTVGALGDLMHHLGEIEALLAFGWAATERLRELVPLLWAYSPYLPADAIDKVLAVVGNEIGFEFPGGYGVEDTAGEPVFPPGSEPLGMRAEIHPRPPRFSESFGEWVVAVGDGYLVYDRAADCARVVDVSRAHRFLTKSDATETADLYCGKAVHESSAR